MMRFSYLLISFLLLLYSCRSKDGNKHLPQDTVQTIRSADTRSKGRPQVGTTIYGDFNGDGQIESAYQIKTREGSGNPIEEGTPDEYAIGFSDSTLPSIPVGCCASRLINEGDLNNDGSDELSVFQAPLNGCVYTMMTYSLNRGNRKQLIEPFIVPAACEGISDEDLQKRIFRDGNAVYFYETDINDEDFRLVRKEAFKIN